MTGRFALSAAVVLILIMALFLGAGILFERDPTGHQVRNWLIDSRYGLFIWRLMLYSVLAWLWFNMVRPKTLEKAPDDLLLRLEWMSVTLILLIELAVWRPVLA
ncbi:TPA: hypothetical protein PXP51_001811 [Yersinia enterocolitica]|uniref:Putative outer membrane protein n=1 Tax=Yersinia enterocolitica TaxID=630 RepID=F2Q810_YEREN|nr:putative outer membrane protein [Yersinia enterocolitica]HDL7749459.1 hypothetical protein [Yersinia enterocolitica]